MVENLVVKKGNVKKGNVAIKKKNLVIKKLSVTVGICACNEEETIGSLLEALLNQKTQKSFIKEIIIVSSKSTDDTNKIIKNFVSRDKRIVFITQKKRLGKVSAMNVVLSKASSEIIVFENADTIPYAYTIERLTAPFHDKKIGLSGGRAIVLNPRDSFLGFINHLLWHIHHELGLKGLKISELVAFRKKLITKIPHSISADESFLETIIKRKKYLSKYVPSAKFLLKCPTTLIAFLNQRRRCYCVQLNSYKQIGYAFPTRTFQFISIIRLGLKYKHLNGLKSFLFALIGLFLEIFARLLGIIDFYIRKETYQKWK